MEKHHFEEKPSFECVTPNMPESGDAGGTSDYQLSPPCMPEWMPDCLPHHGPNCYPNCSPTYPSIRVKS